MDTFEKLLPANVVAIALCFFVSFSSPVRADDASMSQSMALHPPEIESHPFVFTTRSKLKRLAWDSRKIPLAAKQALQMRVIGELRNKRQYLEVYNGCRLTEYLREFSYEQGSATRAASDLALFAYLHRFNPAYGTTVIAKEAETVAKAILLKWATDGMRDRDVVRSRVVQFCDNDGLSTLSAQMSVGLTIGRGLPHWVAAQDLLEGMNALSPADMDEFNHFLSTMANLVNGTLRFRATKLHLDCNRYSNQTSVQIVALAGIARLLQNGPLLVDVANGDGRGVAISWTRQMSKTIYGPGDRPLRCYPSTENASVFHQLATVHSGEIVDRYRAKGGQTLGYPMFSLTQLLLAAVVFDGVDASAYKWHLRDKSLATPLCYYAYYFRYFMKDTEAFIPPVSVQNYPGFAQYAGKLISRGDGTTVTGSDGLITPYILAANLFPKLDAVREVLARAVEVSARNTLGRDIDSLFMDDLPTVADIVTH